MSLSTRAPLPPGRFTSKGSRPGPGIRLRRRRRLVCLVSLLWVAAWCAACASTPDPACLHACDVEWHGCYTSCDKRMQACQNTCKGSDVCEERCRQAHPLWKDRCDEMNDRCNARCESGGA